MPIHETITDGTDGVKGIAELVMDNPPVNALGIKEGYELADILNGYKKAKPEDVRVVILTATGKGFSAGVNIKEIQAMSGNDGILQSNTSCYQLFKAIYECCVPVIVAVNDFCLGTGIGIAGAADIVLAAEGVQFGLPEVDNGALGAATHLMRLVPMKRVRQMLYTCETAPAEELAHYGSVYKVVAGDQLMSEARKVATAIAEKDPSVIRVAKQSVNGIDTVDMVDSYRYEQGFTFELNLMGAGDAAREAFMKGKRESALKDSKGNKGSEKKK